MKISRGTTRVTLLIGKFAFKIPILNRSVKHFVKGWLGNIDENVYWKKTHNQKLCPIYFSLFGLVNIMPKADKVDYSASEFDKRVILDYFSDCDVNIDVCSGWRNYGMYKGELVMIDYAADRESGDQCSDCDNECILKNK